MSHSPIRSINRSQPRLQRDYPGAVPDGQLGTLQRLIREWRHVLARTLVHAGQPVSPTIPQLDPLLFRLQREIRTDFGRSAGVERFCRRFPLYSRDLRRVFVLHANFLDNGRHCTGCLKLLPSKGLDCFSGTSLQDAEKIVETSSQFSYDRRCCRSNTDEPQSCPAGRCPNGTNIE
jgi:hypothetical protein